MLESSQYLKKIWSFASYTLIFTRSNCLHFHKFTWSYTNIFQKLQSELGLGCTNKFNNKAEVAFDIYKPH
jgi:hypothetical protein